MTTTSLGGVTPPSIGEYSQLRIANPGPSVTTRLVVDVISGNALPVSWADVRAVYQYPSGVVRVATGYADSDGRVELIAHHDEPPSLVSVWAGPHPGGLYEVASDMSLVIET